MKLLFDQHLSPGLIAKLSGLFPDSDHVSNVNLGQASDLEVWSYAREHGYAVVSKDADFAEISMLKGFPPKFIWLRIGNCSTEEIERLLEINFLTIEEFGRHPDRGLLALFKNRRV